MHAFGQADTGRGLHITFTLRQAGTLIRVISARNLHRKSERFMNKLTKPVTKPIMKPIMKPTPKFASEGQEPAVGVVAVAEVAATIKFIAGRARTFWAAS